MYPVLFLRILTRTVRWRYGGELLWKAELTMIVSKWISSVIVVPGQWDPGGSEWSPYALGRGIMLEKVLKVGDWKKGSVCSRDIIIKPVIM